VDWDGVRQGDKEQKETTVPPVLYGVLEAQDAQAEMGWQISTAD